MKFIFLIAIFFSLSSFAFSEEVSSVWERLYEAAESDGQRLALMQNLLKQDNREMIPLLQRSLGDLNRRNIEGGSFNEIRQKRELASLLVEKLGELQARGASDAIYQVVEQGKDPHLRGRAIAALGRLRATEYSEQLLLMLEAANIVPDSGKEEKEVLAYYLVQALEQMRMEAAYPAVFFAYTGWYSNSSGVKEGAKSALERMLEDPTEALERIISTAQEVPQKTAALALAAGLNVSGANIGKVAIKALEVGHSLQGRNKSEEQNLANLRKLAIETLIRTNHKDDNSVRWLAMSAPSQSSLERDREEVLGAINALGTNQSPPAVETLSLMLSEYNERQRNGINTNWDLEKTRAIIASLGRTGSQRAAEALMQVEFSGFSPMIVREARRALDQLNP